MTTQTEAPPETGDTWYLAAWLEATNPDVKVAIKKIVDEARYLSEVSEARTYVYAKVSEIAGMEALPSLPSTIKALVQLALDSILEDAMLRMNEETASQNLRREAPPPPRVTQ